MQIKKTDNILLFAAAFLLGMFVCVLLFKYQREPQEKESNETLILSLLKEENDYLSFRTEKLLYLLMKESADTTIHHISLLKKMNVMSDYFNTILSSKKYDSFSMDTVKLILGNSYLGDFYERTRQISFQDKTPIEKELYLNLCFNITLNKCFEEYREYAFMIRGGECVVIPRKDTVKIGDFYEAQIYFSVKDLTETYTIVKDFFTDTTNNVDEVIFKGDVYKEKAITKGLNTRKGLLPFFCGEATRYYPVEFSFYVE